MGTYAAVKFSKESTRRINNFLKEFNLEKDFDDDYHCTLIYSRKLIPFYKTSKGVKQVKNKASNSLSKLISVKGIGTFDTPEGKNLHLVLNCKFCELRFKEAMQKGAEYDYNQYVPHITLLYDSQISDDKLKEMDKASKLLKLEISEEYIEPLNENYLTDKDKK